MATEVVSITHGNEGVRFSWPDSTASVFSNPAYLAESYARAVRDKEHARKHIVEVVSKEINRLESILTDVKPNPLSGELKDLRELLIEAARMLLA